MLEVKGGIRYKSDEWASSERGRGMIHVMGKDVSVRNLQSDREAQFGLSVSVYGGWVWIYDEEWQAHTCTCRRGAECATGERLLRGIGKWVSCHQGGAPGGTG